MIMSLFCFNPFNTLCCSNGLKNMNNHIFFYKRYVDNIFCIVENGMEANNFLNYLNSKHPSIKFTMESEVNKMLPFLDILISSQEGNFRTSVYRKNTFIGLFMNFRSFTPMCYKLGLIRTLIDRAYKISIDRLTFNFEFRRIKEYLCKNMYPPQLIDKQLQKYIKKIETEQEQSEIVNESIKNIFYLKLPFIGTYSKFVQNKVKEISSQFCKNVDIKLVFTSNKVSSFFSTKDKVPNDLRSHVVYKFICACCKASYVGQTTRHFDTRVHEHLYKKSQPSSIFKHLATDEKCRDACNETCFDIIDRDTSPFRLEIKEAIHNEWLKSNVNKPGKLL